MEVLPGIDIADLLDFHEHWMPFIALLAFIVILTFALARRNGWIVPAWWLFVVATGLHTLWLLLMLFSRLTDFAGLAVVVLIILTWPILLTFVALLLFRPRRRQLADPSSVPAQASDLPQRLP